VKPRHDGAAMESAEAFADMIEAITTWISMPPIIRSIQAKQRALSALLPTVTDLNGANAACSKNFMKDGSVGSPTTVEMLAQIDEQFVNFARF